VEDKKSYYAIIPANVRYDADLTPNAKLLYGEITALCNEKGYCWAKNEYFADLYSTSEKSISRWIKNLADKGYIETEVTTFRNNDGTVRKMRHIHIDRNVPYRTDKNVPDHTDKSVHNHIDKNVPDHTDKNEPYNNTSYNNTFSNNTYQSINHKETAEKDPATPMDYERYERLIKNNIGYDVLINEIEQVQLDEIVSIMIEICCTNAKTVRVGKENKHSEVVKSQMLKINSFHIRFVVNRMRETPTRIQNVKSYIVTCLYNAPITMENHYTALINADLHEMNEMD
jgi:hypothetical protein